MAIAKLPDMPAYNPKLLTRENVKRALRRQDFLEYVIGSFPNYQPGWVHQDLARRLEQFAEDVLTGRNPRLIIQMPPRHGKSFLFSERFPTWFISKNPEKNIIVSSYSADLAQSFSKKALDLAQSDYNRDLFPSLRFDDKRQAMDNWGTDKGGGYKSVGVGGSLTGHGADILIIDDPVKDWSEAISARTRDKVWEWWTSTAYTRLMPASGVLVIMTRWHEDDLVGRLLGESEEIKQERELVDAEDLADDGDDWEVISYPAIALEDELHRKKGEALHEERYPLKKLNRIRASVGERVWTALYQQNPRPDGGRYIDRNWFNIIPPAQTPKGLRWVRAWDLAVQAKKSNDETASSLVAQDAEGNIFIKNQTAYRLVWGASKARIIGTAKLEKIPIGIEAVGAMDIAAQEIRDALYGVCIVRSLKVTQDKLTRALPWIDKAENGKVFLVDGDWVHPFLEQCEAFDPMQSVQRDDRIDSVSLAVSMLKQRRKPRIFLS